MPTIITTSAKETQQLGKTIATNLKGGAVLALSGNLGSGKTCLIQGIAKGLGITRTVNSPTFVIFKVYNLKKKNKQDIKQLCHVDAYRLHSARELSALGINEYFSDPQTVTVIEWAEKIKKILPKKTKHIKLQHINEQQRKISWK